MGLSTYRFVEGRTRSSPLQKKSSAIDAAIVDMKVFPDGKKISGFLRHESPRFKKANQYLENNG